MLRQPIGFKAWKPRRSVFEVKIGVDSRPAIGKRTGVGRYTWMLMQELALFSEDSIQAFLPGLYLFKSLECRNNIEQIRSLKNTDLIHPFIPFRALKCMWKQFELPKVEYWLKDLDVFHGTSHYLPPLKNSAGVLTVYDVSFLTLPQYHIKSRREDISSHFAKSVRFAQRIIAISQFTKLELLKHFDFPSERIHVTPLAASTAFCKIEDSSKLNTVQQKYRLPKRFVLSVATVEPRKNLVGLIRAFHKSLPKLPADVQLILVGQLGWLFQPILDVINDLQLESRVRFTGYVDEADLVAIYNLATCFAYVSRYEGFGLPLLEAMSCGLPTISSNNSSLPEVTGSAAMSVDAEDPEEISQAIITLVEDESLRKIIAQKGKEQAALFSWHETVRQTREVYDLARRDIGK